MKIKHLTKTLYTLIFWCSFAIGQSTVIIFNNIDNIAVQDLRECLKGYSAGTIEITQIKLGDRTGQDFFLRSVNNKTEIQYTTQNSLENAIYTYLDILGFRWYGPGDNWYISPKTLPKISIEGKWYKPSFRNRFFFGTAGLDFAKPQVFDQSNSYKQKWHTWKRRNRYNYDFKAAGHSGRNFYLANKPTLEKNIHWFSSEKGMKSGRLKIEYKEAVTLYKNWIQTLFKNNKGDFIVLGVDPEDGRGGPDDPLPPKMPNIKNHADKWWWLANEVAKDYDENNKQIVISAYAYGDGVTNALAPSFKLRKNIYPILVPYAFQRAYLPPEEMIFEWSKKVTGYMAIRDYWNITQWSLGVPQFNLYTLKQKLDLWEKYGIDGINIETTDAAGPMGHALWLAGQLQWDNSQNFEKLYSQYLVDCFGNAAQVMRRMFDRWSLNYQGLADVSFTMYDLKQAEGLVNKKSNYWKRITELKAYVLYLKLFYELDGSQERKNKLFIYMYQIHHLMMVQTAAFINQKYIKPFDKGNILPLATSISQLPLEDIDDLFQKTLKNTPKPYTISSFVFDFDKVGYISAIDNKIWKYGSVRCNFFFKAPFSGTLELDAGGMTNTDFLITVGGQKIYREFLGKNNSDYTETLDNRTWFLKKIKITIEKGKEYHIQARSGNARVKVKTSGIVLFKKPGTEDFDNYQYPIQYFYVPQNATEIIFSDPHLEGRNGKGYLISPTGEKQKRESTAIKNMHRVVVPQKWRGKVWKASFAHPIWSFKNIPNYTSLQDFQYIED